MDKKRTSTASDDCQRVNKVARTMQEGNEGWEWPVLTQRRAEMLPYWVVGQNEGQQMPHGVAAPAASWQTRDTLSLGTWANRQGSLELSLGAGYGLQPIRSPDCDGEGSDMEDTATSSCSESSGGSAQHSDCNCNSEGQQHQTPRGQQTPAGEDDSITSNQPFSAPSAAFSFGCVPGTAACIEALWPAVAVGAQ